MKNHFGELIYEIAEAKGLRITDLASQVPNTAPSTFSKIRAGNYAKLTDDRLTQIAQALAPDDPNTQVLLIVAYLWDMCPENFHHNLDIKPKSPKGYHAPSKKVLSGKLQTIHHQLDTIARASAQNKAFKEHVTSMSRLAETILAQQKASSKQPD